MKEYVNALLPSSNPLEARKRALDQSVANMLKWQGWKPPSFNETAPAPAVQQGTVSPGLFQPIEDHGPGKDYAFLPDPGWADLPGWESYVPEVGDNTAPTHYHNAFKQGK